MEENEHSIIRAVLSGNKEAYGTLVVRHSRAIFRVAFRITGDEADAEDVVQEAFLIGYQKLQIFDLDLPHCRQLRSEYEEQTQTRSRLPDRRRRRCHAASSSGGRHRSKSRAPPPQP